MATHSTTRAETAPSAPLQIDLRDIGPEVGTGLPEASEPAAVPAGTTDTGQELDTELEARRAYERGRTELPGRGRRPRPGPARTAEVPGQDESGRGGRRAAGP